MAKSLLIAAFLLTAGCTHIPAPDGCAYWAKRQWAASQQAWRNFDCPTRHGFPDDRFNIQAKEPLN